MAITNRTVYAEPTLPTIGAAGSTFTDPTFGSRMGRVTDSAWTTDLGSTGRSFRSPGSGYQCGWNMAGTKALIGRGDGNYFVASVNRSTMTSARHGNALTVFGSLTFSSYVPDLIYGNSVNRVIASCDVTSTSFVTTTVIDIDSLIGGLSSPQTYIGALTEGSGNILVTCGGTGQEYHHYAVHYPIDDPGSVKILDSQTGDVGANPFNMHSAQLDKSGRFASLIVSYTSSPMPPYGTYIWDTLLETVTPVTSNSGGHEILTFGKRFNSDTLTTFDAFQTIRTPLLTAPNSNKTELVSPLGSPIEVYAADHSSGHNATAGTDEPIALGVYRYFDGPNNIDPVNNVAFRAWDNEIVTLATDGTGVVTRYCHHRSPVWPFAGTAAFNFWDTPRPNVNTQGDMAYFTSNWDKSLGWDAGDSEYRQDVFLVELSEAARRAYRRARRFR